MKFADNRIRVHYFMDNKSPIYGSFVNSSSDYVPKEADNRTTLITIKQSSQFRQQLKIDLGDVFVGLRSYSVFFHSKETEDLEKYNNWNFSTSQLWDEFWFSADNLMLFRTELYVIGSSEADTITIRMYPSVEIHKNQNSSSGGDLIKTHISFKKNLNINQDGRVPMRPGTNSSTINVMIDYDFTERQITYDYYSTFDVFAKIGGIFAFVGPIVATMTPFVALYFLYALANILID